LQFKGGATVAQVLHPGGGAVDSTADRSGEQVSETADLALVNAKPNETPPSTKNRSKLDLGKVAAILGIVLLPLATMVNYAHTIGEAATYGIPTDLLSFQLTSLIVPILITMAWLAVLAFFLIFLIGVLAIPLRVYRATGLTALMLGLLIPPYTWSSLAWWLVTFPSYILLFYAGPWVLKRTPLLFRSIAVRARRSLRLHNHVRLVGRFIWRYTLQPIVTHLREAPSKTVMRLQMLALSACILFLVLPALYIGAAELGEWNAREQTNYGVITTTSDSRTATVILKVYGGKVYQASINRETKRMTGNIRVSNLEDLKDVDIRRERIGPLSIDS
jgi:hypothetical protein